MKILDQQGDQENEVLIKYVRLWETFQLKRSTEELKTGICLSSQRRETIEEGKG
jgi:hypothetical protein